MRHLLRSLHVIAPALLGCSLDIESEPLDPPETVIGADGERGVGTFDTMWGILRLEYVWMDGRMIHDGDIVLSPEDEIKDPVGDTEDGLGEASSPLLRGAKKWAMVNGVVTIPYSFASDVGETRRKKIEAAMKEWESEIGFLDFVPSSIDSGRRVRFVTWNKNYCSVNGSNTDLNIVKTSVDCGWITYVHELGHVLGFKHEQRRSDRGSYVVYEKTRTCAASEFWIYGDEDNHVGTYDHDSIMHYPSCMFANSHATCEDTGICNSNTPNKWVLTRKPAYGPGYIPWWEQRSAGNVIKSGDKCNFKSLYGIACGGDPVCIPNTCESLGKECGTIEDGCGSTIQCGGCSSPEVCGGGGTPNMCGASNPFPVPPSFAGTFQNSGACMTSGTSVEMATCNGSLSQSWWMTGERQWKNANSAKCARVAGLWDDAGLTQASCTASDELQKWRLKEMEIVHGSTGRCLNVPYGNYHDGQNVIIMPCDGKLKQQFAYRPTTYEIGAGGWCLDAATASGVAGGNDIKLRECDGTLSQQWNDRRGGFVNREATNLCMRIEGGASAPNGSNIEVATCNDSVGQMWGLRGAFEQWDDNYCLTSNDVGNQVTIAHCDGTKAQLFTKWSSH